MNSFYFQVIYTVQHDHEARTAEKQSELNNIGKKGRNIVIKQRFRPNYKEILLEI